MDDASVPRAVRVGARLGDWQIDEVLGVGAMGSVVRARRSDGVEAALKVLHPHLAEIAHVRKRFLREGPLGQALTTLAPLCEGIPQVLESGELPDGTAYLAMELLVGETADERLARDGPWPVEHVLGLAEQVLDVLVMAHRHGIIHRDLKPENLHIGEAWRVRVLDFGIARLLDPLPDGVGTLPAKTATKTGVTLGTVGYMAPEQATGLIEHIDGRSDLFGLGATMFELLAGRCIHQERGDARMLIAAATKPAPPLASVVADLPPAVCAVVDKSLAFLKTNRYPDATSMRADVRALRHGQPPPHVAAR